MLRVEQYQHFAVWWVRCLKPYSARFSSSPFPTITRGSKGELELDTVVHLIRWPESSQNVIPGAKHRTLDILVHAQERLSSGRPYRILESKIKVTYLRVDAQQHATPLSTVRYDYDREPRPGHPIYHFHCDNDPISEDLFPPSCRYEKLEKQVEGPCFPFRIPTPHMCLCNVLIGLVADHLPSENFRGLWEVIRNEGWIPPSTERCELWSLGCANGGPRILHNWQWYFWPAPLANKA